VSGAKYEEKAKEKTRDAACNDALAFSQLLIWLLPNTSNYLFWLYCRQMKSTYFCEEPKFRHYVCQCQK